MAGRPRADELAPYVAKKKNAKGASYSVWVQPFNILLTYEDGTSKWVQRKKQSDPFDEADQRARDRALRQAITRAAEEKAKLHATPAPIPKTEPKRVVTLADVSKERLALITIYGQNASKARGAKGSTEIEYVKNMARARTTEPSIADRDLTQLTSQEIRAHLAAFAKSHAESTYDRYHSHLHSLGAYAEEEAYWQKNLFPRLGKRAKRTYLELPNPSLALSEVLALNKRARLFGPQMVAAFRLLRLGFRAGEVVALSEDDIDFASNRIRIRYSQTEKKPQWAGDRKATAYLEETKTPASSRIVSVHNQLLADIKCSLERSKAVAVPAWDDDGVSRPRRFVLCNKQGGLWRYTNYLRIAKQVFEQAGVDISERFHGSSAAIRFNHIWRNTYAADLVALGADDMQLKSLMRHLDANTSKAVYASARQEQLLAFARYREKIDKLEQFNWMVTKIDLDMESGQSPFLTRQISMLEFPGED